MELRGTTGHDGDDGGEISDIVLDVFRSPDLRYVPFLLQPADLIINMWARAGTILRSSIHWGLIHKEKIVLKTLLRIVCIEMPF